MNLFAAVGRRATVAGDQIRYDGATIPGIWIDQWKIGSVVRYKGDVIEIDAEFAARALDSFNRALDQGFLSIVRKQHKREGIQYGINAAMRIGPQGWIQTFTGILDSNLKGWINNRQALQWSPGFGDVENPHTGEVYRDLLVETSFVDSSHQWTNRSPAVTNPGVALGYTGHVHTFESIGDTMKEQNTPTEIDGKEIEAPHVEAPAEDVPAWAVALSEDNKKTRESMAAIAAVLEKLATPAPAPAEMSAEARVIELEAQLVELRHDNTVKELQAAGFDLEMAKPLALLRQISESDFQDAKKAFAAEPNRPVILEPQAEKGVQGSATTDGPTPIVMWEAAKKEGLTLSSGKIPMWLTNNFEAVTEDDITAVRELALKGA